MEGTKNELLEDDEDFEDQELRNMLEELGYGNAEFEIFAAQRISWEQLVTVAGMGEGPEYATDWLKDKLPKLAEDACCKIAAKATDTSNDGPITDEEKRLYAEKVAAIKGGMLSQAGIAKKFLQAALKALSVRNTSDTAKPVRKLFKEAMARGFIE